MSSDSQISPRKRQSVSEGRLEEIRRHASAFGPGNRSQFPAVQGPSASSQTGYYGLPLLKAPPWQWEVPAYFFTGGAAGAAAVIAGIGDLCRADRRLIRDARWVAAVCGAVSPPLLVADLGRPWRFLNMLRVFKWRSPMSVGSWTLAAFSGAAAAALSSDLILREGGLPARFLGGGSQLVATLTGLPLATYTGVLLGATAIPVWWSSVTELPIHFAASGLGAAVSMLELKGHSANHALNRLGMGSAAVETAIGIRALGRRDPAIAAIKSGRIGWVRKAGALLSGPIPIVLRLLAGNSGKPRSRGLRRAAAFSALAGSLLTRYAWVHAGRASALDPALPLELGEQASAASGDSG